MVGGVALTVSSSSGHYFDSRVMVGGVALTVSLS